MSAGAFYCSVIEAGAYVLLSVEGYLGVDPQKEDHHQEADDDTDGHQCYLLFDDQVQ